MKLKTIIVFASLLLAVSPEMYAQGFLKKLKDKAVETVKNKVEQKVEKEVGNGADAVLNGKKNDKKQDSKAEETPAAESKGNTKRDAAQETVKSDFVRGSQIMYQDNQAGEQVGEFPSKWDLVRGNAEIAKVDGRPVIALNADDSWISPLMKDGSHDYLGNIFTMEFDIMYPAEANGSFEWDFMEKDQQQDSECFTVTWNAANDDQNENENYIASWKVGESTRDAQAVGPCISDGEWHHMALSFNQRALKVYVDGKRVINVPNAPVLPGWVTLWSNGNNAKYIKDVIIARGAVELYGQNETDADAVTKAIEKTGKFVTNNILFETGKADIKAESMAEIQKVADYMKKNPTVRFEIQGHCDNQGSDKVNDPLSQARAEAIVKALAGLGVDEWNLKAVGKGSHEPVADNSTEEGRAKNRRVEFIKR